MQLIGKSTPKKVVPNVCLSIKCQMKRTGAIVRKGSPSVKVLDFGLPESTNP